MINKYFKVYDDLVVREIVDKDINNDKNVFAVITYSQSNLSFKPNFFSPYKKGKETFLWEFKVEGEIVVSQHFKLEQMVEITDQDQTRNYYKQLVFTLIDNFGEKFSFDAFSNKRKFCVDPDHLITHIDLQNFLNDIMHQINHVKSFEAFYLSKKIIEQEKIIEQLESNNS